ncbi:hypothetical protein [Ochrobactrum sp. AP1BH01-1]|jgi:hypothetical protein|uniref:hypothetical protein n=1 Tax=Ochrobactrum sp. AP1BH01-1 TaxID=2823874 RepID=UPI001B37DE90|nr:hypothetical protein [Ochrobactrum sp. AP1BH01-1]MBQ0710311.1 hypothetical protein [Ochrobactrum sp. AP1BH01-1]
MSFINLKETKRSCSAPKIAWEGVFEHSAPGICLCLNRHKATRTGIETVPFFRLKLFIWMACREAVDREGPNEACRNAVDVQRASMVSTTQAELASKDADTGW